MGASPKYLNITPKLYPQVGCLGEKMPTEHMKKKKKKRNTKEEGRYKSAYVWVGIHKVICVFPVKRGMISQPHTKELWNIQQRKNVTTREKLPME